jgi:hypothetical protein
MAAALVFSGGPAYPAGQSATPSPASSAIAPADATTCAILSAAFAEFAFIWRGAYNAPRVSKIAVPPSVLSYPPLKTNEGRGVDLSPCKLEVPMYNKADVGLASPVSDDWPTHDNSDLTWISTPQLSPDGRQATVMMVDVHGGNRSGPETVVRLDQTGHWTADPLSIHVEVCTYS